MRVLCFVAILSVALAKPWEKDAQMAGTKMTFSSGSSMQGGAMMGGQMMGGQMMGSDGRMGRMADMGTAKITKITKTVTTQGSGLSGLGVSGHSGAWSSGMGSWGSDSKMAGGRSAWDSSSAMGVAKIAKLSEGPAMASWDSQSKMAAAGRSGSWEAAHMHRDAQPVIEILQQEYQMPEPGSYVYSYKTANGIEAQEHAAMKAQDAEAVEGVYSWVAPSGEKFAVEYVADETGFHAKGAHIPEMPVAIARSLEWNAAHPEEDDKSWEAESMSSGKVASGRTAWDSSAKLSGLSSGLSSGVSSGLSSWGADSKFASGRSAWASQPSQLGGASYTKITKTSNIGSSGLGADSGMLASGRSAWASEPSQLGGGSYTKITKTISSSGLGADSGLLASGRSAWKSDASQFGGASSMGQVGYSGLALHDDKLNGHAFAGPAGFAGRSIVTNTKVVEHGPAHQVTDLHF